LGQAEERGKEVTYSKLYQFLLKEQARIRGSLDQNEEGPEAELLRGQWAMAQRIIEDFALRPEIEEMH